jgi:hypothetical protein
MWISVASELCGGGGGGGWFGPAAGGAESVLVVSVGVGAGGFGLCPAADAVAARTVAPTNAKTARTAANLNLLAMDLPITTSPRESDFADLKGEMALCKPKDCRNTSNCA